MLASVPASDPTPSETPLQRLLRLTGVATSQTISIAGPGGLGLMVELCLAGYERVECARRSTCQGADETSHLLILTGPAEGLGGLAASALPLLRAGGMVAAWLDRIEDDAPIRAALMVRGMDILASTLDHQDGLMVAHRVRRRGRLALVG